MASKGRVAASVAALFLERLNQSLNPSVGYSYAGKPLSWKGASLYFEGLSDPYKVFEFTVPDGHGGTMKVSKSTAQLLKIEQAGYIQGQNELRAILQGLIDGGVCTESNPWEGAGAPQPPNAYRHLKDPAALISDYPFTNDVYMPDMTRKTEGMAVPRRVSPMYLTPKVFDANAFPTDRMFAVSGAILTAIRLIHGSCNANAMMSPAVNIALNRLGYTDTIFRNMDLQAAADVVPKRTGIPAIEANRGAWADNRFFGDPSRTAAKVYSNKNSYLPQLGNLGDTHIENILRNGPQSSASTRFINPCFPEWFRPIHLATMAPGGSRPDAGFTLIGQTDPIYVAAANRRRPLFTFSDMFETNADFMASTDLHSEQFRTDGWLTDLAWRVHMSYYTRGEYGDPEAAIRRLRDWYLTNKPKCDIRMADPITDFATLVQLARFIAYVPPHVLLHSVMGFHNAMLKLAFENCGVPYSTSITEYQTLMRRERDGIAALSASQDLVNASGSSDLGYALTVKAPDSIILSNADLRDTTVASLSIAAAATAANPVAGVVCFALVACAIIYAEVTGNTMQPLITPRDRSREDIRDTFNGGIRCNWYRGITPEHIVNTSPVLRV